MLLRAPFWVLIAGVAVAQDRVALNTLSQIELRGHVLEITGTQKPSFTTFTLTDPPRLVIDFSESVFKGVPSELRVNNGTVTSVKTVAYGSAAAAIARVVIGFEKEAETEIWVEGMVLKIKIPWATVEAKPSIDAGIEVASKESPVAGARLEEAKAGAADETAEKERLQREKESAEKIAREEAAQKALDEKAEKQRLLREKQAAEKLAREEAAQKAAAERAEKERIQREKLEAEKRAREEAAQKALAEKAEKERLQREKREAEKLAREEAIKRAAEEKAERERQQKEKREAEKLAREEAAKRAAEEKAAIERAKKEKAEAEKLAREEMAKRAAEEKAEKERAKKDKAEAEQLARDQAAKQASDERAEKERIRQQTAEAEKALRDELEAKAALEKADAPRLKNEKADAEKLAREEAAKKAAQDRAERERITQQAAQADLAARESAKRGAGELAKAQPPAPKASDASATLRVAAAKPEAKNSEPINMTGISFKQSRGAGRVSIRLSGNARFGVREDRDRNVVVSLENARILLPNNERVLDTSFFDTAVAMIRPEAAQQNINVLIVLKQQVPYRVSQSGNEVSVDFEAPLR